MRDAFFDYNGTGIMGCHNSGMLRVTSVLYFNVLYVQYQHLCFWIFYTNNTKNTNITRGIFAKNMKALCNNGF